MTEPADPDLRRRLATVAATLPTLEAPGFVAGRWHDAERMEDGVWSMPWFELGDEAMAVVRAIAGAGFVQPFDWMAWAPTPEAVALRNDRAALAAATPDQLQKLLTMLVREDRFSEGSLAESFESGLIAAIARRAKVLAGGARPSS